MPLGAGKTVLTLRTGKPGVLELRGLAGYRLRPTDTPQRQWLMDNALHVATSAGYAETHSLHGEPVACDIRSPGGQITIKLTLAKPVRYDTFLHELTWAWKPDGVTVPLASSR